MRRGSCRTREGGQGPRVRTFLCEAALCAAVALVPSLAPSRTAAQQTPPASLEVTEAGIPQLQDAMAAGVVTAVDLVDAYLARIAAYDVNGPMLNAMLRINPNARADAAALDAERRERGARGPLHGIPIILKDNFDVAGMPTTGGSVALAGATPVDDGFQVRRLREAGAVILGKSNMHELASGITTISSLGGQTRNPYDATRNPGGSSGGTGAAIAASFAALGWGTDTCGSIRIPSSQNNLFGLRPTKGLSSIDGILPLCHTQDVAGPLARSVTDLAIGLDATVGYDPADPATAAVRNRPLPRFVEALDPNALRGARLGVLTAYFGEGPEEAAMGEVVHAALEQMEELGAVIVELSIPDLDSALRGSGVIDYEFKFDLIDYLAVTPGAPVTSLTDILERGLYHAELGPRFERRNRVETPDSDEYLQALAKRDTVREVVLAAMDANRLDAVVYPTMRRPPSLIGEPQRGSNCQLSASAGLPALSLPAGFTTEGLPASLELLGRPFDDPRLVALAYAFEQAVSPRRAPATTPPLIGAEPPAPVVAEISETGANGVTMEATFTYDPQRAVLGYRIAVGGLDPDDLYAVSLDRGNGDRTGPVLHRLLGPATVRGDGEVHLASPLQDELRRGHLFVTVYTRVHPLGAVRRRVSMF